MRQRRFLSLLVAAILVVGAAAPRLAAGQTPGDATNAPAPVVAHAGDVAAPAEKDEGNGFVRALTAPFRALAKLFGGDKKNSPASAKAKKRNTRGNASKRKSAAARDEQVALARIKNAPAGEPRARTMPAPPPLMWKPYIENVPMDHLSQGRALLEFGYFGEAVAELSLAASVGPDLVEANNLLGQAYD
ncbi:MAG TPA: hypothetical protein VGV38_07420, partial [Pyrinomonadaceae bacterium]|nr:hypothetical protein [Pyrinomonadaceae bacterium]